MKRRIFLEKLGLGAAFVLTTNCFQSCSKETIGPVDFTINLEDPNYGTLKTNGKYIVKDNVVVVRGIDGLYYAATVICSHEQKKQVKYDPVNNGYHCTAHSADFDLQGKGLNKKWIWWINYLSD